MATASLRDCLQAYVSESWTEQDSESHQRARAINMRGEVALDRDPIERYARYAPFFDDFMPRFDGKGWASIGLRTGPDFWSLTLHRSPRQGPFEETERAVLQQFSVRLNEVGSLAHLVGRVTLSTVATSFDQIGKAVVAIDQTGRFIHANATAQRLLSSSIQITDGRLMLRDRHAAAEYRRVISRLQGLREGRALRAAPDHCPAGERDSARDQVSARRRRGEDAVRVHPSPAAPPRAVRAGQERVAVFGRAFGLTPAEARGTRHASVLKDVDNRPVLQVDAHKGKQSSAVGR
ncbi:MAG: hypothetical protein QHC90_22765 [Shinella sp.]|nr:hypothetical protein [Shinella sp.]